MIAYEMSFSAYLAMLGVHFSALKHMATSPLHYRRACDRERSDTPSLRLGRLTHAFVLTPELPQDVAVFGGKVRRGKAWEEFEADASRTGKLIVRADELAAAERMRDAVHANPVARNLLAGGRGEVTVTWDEQVPVGSSSDLAPTMDLACKARLDWIGPRGLVELKTTRWPGARSWAREVVARSYHVQLAHYRSGVTSDGTALPTSLPAWWIVVENIEPHDVAVYRVSDNDVETGERIRQSWLQRVAECEATGRWPGVGGDAPIDFVLPDYAAFTDAEDVDLGGIEGAENVSAA